MLDIHEATAFASGRLAASADPAKAAPMARYMKTDMPFYGVQKPGRVPIIRELARRWPPSNRTEYHALVTALWELPHREEKYVAIGVARSHDRFVSLTSVPLFLRLVRQGAWWDLVDEVAIKLIGRVLERQRSPMTPRVRQWISHPDLWVRRSAIISQVGHGAETDTQLLFDACLARSHETDFFIRKAIGWALRDYAWTSPDEVRRFVRASADRLSSLSRREALKNL